MITLPDLDIRCPACQSDNLKICQTVQLMWEDGLPDDEQDNTRYPALSHINGVAADGTIQYEGTTDYNDLPGKPCYDTCEVVQDENKHPLFFCCHCYHEWYEPRAHE